jgi:HlyD family secretion protein
MKFERIRGSDTETGRRGLGRRRILIGGAALVLIAALAWWLLSGPSLPPGIAAGNGRLEANEIYVAAKFPGRIAEVLVDEGDVVQAGQVVARMDTEELEARLRQAEARIREAEDARAAALANVETRRASISGRSAEIAARQAEHVYARQQYARSRQLVPTGAVSEQEAQLDNSRMLSTRADLAGSQAQLSGARQELVAAQAEAVRATSTIAAARAEADRIRAEIRDSVLTAPIRGRVESRLAEPGEVLAAGGRVFSVVDLSDVYMYVFLPERVTGRIAIGSEARIVLDAAPQYPIRATVSFISPTAQFTPKTVETQEERHNLTFRVKLQIPRERLARYENLVRVGIPGMGYVRYDESAVWPAELQPPARIPENLWAPSGRDRSR